MKFIRKLLSRQCAECRDVRVWFWQGRCAFCDKGEGVLK